MSVFYAYVMNSFVASQSLVLGDKCSHLERTLSCEVLMFLEPKKIFSLGQ